MTSPDAEGVESPLQPVDSQPVAPAPPDTAALYLAKRLCADGSHVLGTFPEAAALLEASDIVLTKSDGHTVQITCILDRERLGGAGRALALTREQLIEIGAACLRYTGTVNGIKMPVHLRVWDVGPGAGTPDDMARLRALARTWPGDDKVSIHAWAIDTTTARVTAVSRLARFFHGVGRIEKMLREPRISDEQMAHTPAAVRDDGGTPWVTIAMMALLAVMYVGEVVFGVRPASSFLSPDILTLVANGGLMRSLVENGEWYRVFTAAFLHADLLHLALNGFALMMAGVVLEHLLGRAWLLALFVVGALGGSALSMVINEPNIVSVGASGAIMGLLAAAFVTSFRLPESQRSAVLIPLLQILIPSLIPLSTSRTGGQVDFGAHLGGALVGALAGGFLLLTWSRTSPMPRFRAVAAAIAVAGVLLFGYGFWRVAQQHDDYAQAARAEEHAKLLIPDEEVARDVDDALLARAEALIASHPRDPRGYVLNALRLQKAEQLEAAEASLRRGLEEREILATNFPDGNLETSMRAMLAALLVDRGERAQAVEIVTPMCKRGENGSVPEALQSLGLCP